jgi:hypothetical protein
MKLESNNMMMEIGEYGKPRWKKEFYTPDGTKECMYVEEVDYKAKKVFLVTEVKSGKKKDKKGKEEKEMDEFERYFKETKYISDSNPLDNKSSMLTKLANYTGHRE